VGPEDAPTLDASGNLYGTTNTGGTREPENGFQTRQGGKETVLHSLTGACLGRTPTQQNLCLPFVHFRFDFELADCALDSRRRPIMHFSKQ